MFGSNKKYKYIIGMSGNKKITSREEYRPRDFFQNISEKRREEVSVFIDQLNMSLNEMVTVFYKKYVKKEKDLGKLVTYPEDVLNMAISLHREDLKENGAIDYQLINVPRKVFNIFEK